MSGLTTHGAEAILAGEAVPSPLWVQLHIGDPGTEGTANGAVEDTRQSVTLEPGDDDAVAVNDAPASWSSLPADETASWFTLWDDETAGDPWFVGTISPTLALVLAGTATLAQGRLYVTAGRHGV